MNWINKINFNRLKKEQWFVIGFLLIVLLMISWIIGGLYDLKKRRKRGEKTPRWIDPILDLLPDAGKVVETISTIALTFLVPVAMMFIGVVLLPTAPIIGGVVATGGLIFLAINLWLNTNADENEEKEDDVLNDDIIIEEPKG